MGTTNTTIATSIAAIDSEIERLTVARNALAGLIATNGDEPAPARKPRASRKASTKATASKSTAKKNGNGGGQRRDQIIALLKKDMTPRQIGDKLGIAPNYVYHVKRALASV